MYEGHTHQAHLQRAIVLEFILFVPKIYIKIISSTRKFSLIFTRQTLFTVKFFLHSIRASYALHPIWYMYTCMHHMYTHLILAFSIDHSSLACLKPPYSFLHLLVGRSYHAGIHGYVIAIVWDLGVHSYFWSTVKLISCMLLKERHQRTKTTT